MLFENIMVVAFAVILVLSILSLIPSTPTGNFLQGSNTDLSIFLIIISAAIIFAIKVPKKHYNPIPSRK